MNRSFPLWLLLAFERDLDLTYQRGVLRKQQVIPVRALDLLTECIFDVCAFLAVAKPLTGATLLSSLFPNRDWKGQGHVEVFDALSEEITTLDAFDLGYALSWDMSFRVEGNADVPWEWIGRAEFQALLCAGAAKAVFLGLAEPDEVLEYLSVKRQEGPPETLINHLAPDFATLAIVVPPMYLDFVRAGGSNSKVPAGFAKSAEIGPRLREAQRWNEEGSAAYLQQFAARTASANPTSAEVIAQSSGQVPQRRRW